MRDEQITPKKMLLEGLLTRWCVAMRAEVSAMHGGECGDWDDMRWEWGAAVDLRQAHARRTAMTNGRWEDYAEQDFIGRVASASMMDDAELSAMHSSGCSDRDAMSCSCTRTAPDTAMSGGGCRRGQVTEEIRCSKSQPVDGRRENERNRLLIFPELYQHRYAHPRTHQ
jgi:hypothetical protein